MFLVITDMRMPELGYSGQSHLTPEQKGTPCFRGPLIQADIAQG